MLTKHEKGHTSKVEEEAIKEEDIQKAETILVRPFLMCSLSNCRCLSDHLYIYIYLSISSLSIFPSPSLSIYLLYASRFQVDRLEYEDSEMTEATEILLQKEFSQVGSFVEYMFSAA